MPVNKNGEQRPGIAVDAKGGGVVDPSQNVKELSEASNKRQDDLRAASDVLFESKAKCLEEKLTLIVKHVNDISLLRADYTEKLSIAESKRIDAIRSVDVNAVSVAAQRSADQATVLAAQVATSAETLRNLVATTAAAVQQGFQSITTALSTRITTLEQAQYKGEGQSGVRDPAITDALSKMQDAILNLAASRDAAAGQSKGISTMTGLLIALGGLAIAAVTMAAKFL